MKPLKGFTLIEVIMVVTLLASTIGLVTAWTLTSLKRAELQSTTEVIVGILRKQQTSAMSSKGNLDHGIRLESDQYTIFAGPDYATSSANSRQTFSMPNQLTISNITLAGGGSDLIFNKASGETAQDGTLSITHTSLSESMTISVNTLGLIDWQ